MTDKKTYTIEEIKDVLVHRYPFLLLDRITDLNDNHIVGIKNITINEPYFVGHFPQKPVVPAVLMLESMAQISGFYIAKMIKDLPQDALGFYVGINKAKFKKIVQPGDQLVIESTLLSRKGGLCKFSCQASVEDVIATSAEISLFISKSH